MDLTAVLKALANERRLQILEWLQDPPANFPPQVDGDLAKDGVCGVAIVEFIASLARARRRLQSKRSARYRR